MRCARLYTRARSHPSRAPRFHAPLRALLPRLPACIRRPTHPARERTPTHATSCMINALFRDTFDDRDAQTEPHEPLLGSHFHKTPGHNSAPKLTPPRHMTLLMIRTHSSVPIVKSVTNLPDFATRRVQRTCRKAFRKHARASNLLSLKSCRISERRWHPLFLKGHPNKQESPLWRTKVQPPGACIDRWNVRMLRSVSLLRRPTGRGASYSMNSGSNSSATEPLL